MTTEPLHAVNHVFVDFENVHQADHAVIGTKTVFFNLLLGPKQARLGTDLVEKLVKHSASVQMIRLTSEGKNALDFALAYYVGQAVAMNPGCHVHIVSKDKGFDPLIEHLRTRGVSAKRHVDFSSLTFGVPGRNPSDLPSDPYERAVEHLRRSVTNRPKKLVKLRNKLGALNGSCEHMDVDAVVARLTEERMIVVGDKEAVEYRLG